MKTILVIEDNPLNMKLAIFLLENAGYHTIQALSAEDGIRLANEKQPDLILMDVQLPGMDGLTATRVLKADTATQGIKIIAMTACAMIGDRERIQEAGCDGYIGKPIFIQEFQRIVANILGNEEKVE
jgi:two-component system cell cycle response regulator DivK